MPQKLPQKLAREFDLIQSFFAPLAGPEGLGLMDDAACLKVGEGMDIVVSKDMLVEGVHFHKTDKAYDIARKALGVNLSDIAAKGAEPGVYFLGLALGEMHDDVWLLAFSKGLEHCQDTFGVRLAGGDTVSSKNGLVISITIMGDVRSGQMLQRTGACPGDIIWASGTLGDAALGLKCLQGEIAADPYLEDRYHVPQPRVHLGKALNGVATSCIDISDGLLADIGHICRASKVGAVIQRDLLPVSRSAEKIISDRPDLSELVYSGGDDYELVFTSSPNRVGEVERVSQSLGIKLTNIGTIIKDHVGVSLLDQEGRPVQTGYQGYTHF